MKNSSDLILKIESLEKRFGKTILFENFDLTIKRNSFTALMGPNGSGKSTLLNIIGGLIPINSGKIIIGSSNRDFPQANIHPTIIFQEPRLLPWKTAIDNVTFGLKLAGEPRELRNKKAKEVMERLEVYSAHNKYPNELSGGMQQKLNIARAIITEPEFLLIDEPFNNLDVLTIAEISKFLEVYNHEEETTILMVNHIIELSSTLAISYIFLNGGINGKIKRNAVILEQKFNSSALSQKIQEITHGIGVISEVVN